MKTTKQDKFQVLTFAVVDQLIAEGRFAEAVARRRRPADDFNSLTGITGD